MSIYFKNNKISKPYRGANEVDFVFKNEIQYWPTTEYTQYMYIYWESIGGDADNCVVHYAKSKLTEDYRAFKVGEKWSFPGPSSWGLLDTYGHWGNKKIIFEEEIKPKTLLNLFTCGTYINTITNISNVNTEYTTDMSDAFFGMSRITTLDLTSWDVSNVTDFTGIFSNMYSLTSLNLKDWSPDATASLASSIDPFASVFQQCSNLQTIYCNKNWYNISGNKLGSNMFSGCTGLDYYQADKENLTMAYPNSSGMQGEGYFTFQW